MIGIVFSDEEQARMLRDAVKAVRDHADSCSPDLGAKLRYVADAAAKECERLDGRAGLSNQGRR
jgi:hypothetical protein